MAREKDRIIRMLAKIHEIWDETPDMRLGQLLVNLDVAPPNTDIFYIEDDVMEKTIDTGIASLREKMGR